MYSRVHLLACVDALENGPPFMRPGAGVLPSMWRVLYGLQPVGGFCVPPFCGRNLYAAHCESDARSDESWDVASCAGGPVGLGMSLACQCSLRPGSSPGRWCSLGPRRSFWECHCLACHPSPTAVQRPLREAARSSNVCGAARASRGSERGPRDGWAATATRTHGW
jgi:hypothetical protein